jgi:hypothetical protein
MKIEVVCKKPPIGLLLVIRSALRWIGCQDLRGLGKIVLAEDLSDFAKDDNGPVSRRGYYLLPTNDAPPSIILSVPELYKGIPLIFQLSPVTVVQILDTLAHEVGHHLAFLEGEFNRPILREREVEGFADRYAKAVIQSLKKQYLYRVGRWGLNELADWYFWLGLAAARRNAQQLAAQRFYLAWHLNNEHKYAADHYYQAIRICMEGNHSTSI